MKVKYLYHRFKKAREKNLLNEYLFYLQLRSIGFSQNEMYKGDLIKTIQTHLDLSPASISIQLKKLVKNGFVDLYKHDSNKEWKYVLKSYKKVWNLLGFRFKKYIQRFKFEFIDLQSLRSKADLKALVFAFELKRNKEKQEFKVRENIESRLQYHQETLSKVKSSKVKEKKEAALEQLKSKLKTSLDESLLGGGFERPMENKISCRRAAQLLGFKTNNVSVKLHKKAEDLNLLTVKKSKTLLATSVPRVLFSVNPEYKDCYWQFGKVFRNECNVYFFSSYIQKTSSQQVPSL
jgi:predicted transcriptional regulator